MYTNRLSRSRVGYAALLACALGAFAGNVMAADAGVSADPPDRVARISFLRGSVSFQPAGDDQWAEASLNRPLGTGDKVYTDTESRVELEVGAANVRLDQNSTFDLLNLDDSAAQIELTDGVMNLDVRRIGDGESIEVDTPTLAFVVDQPGNYRIDVAPAGDSTMITVLEGAGDVYGENNASYSVRAGNSYRFNDSALHDYEVLDLPRADDFDQWCQSRNTRYEGSVSSRYVAEDVIGYTDLDHNGSWSDVPEYGNVWYPTTVAVDWAPYRSGHWSWIDPWGWTWVDAAAWGFAPFHYGRWAYIGNRWGWCPGERRWGSVYAPALVGFVGGNGWGGASLSIGGGGPIGWFPLGPRDVYVPWYRASRSYFSNINLRNSHGITNVNITNIYNNYSSGRPITNVNYAYRANAAALTAVSRETFVGARPVAGARVRVNDNLLRSAQVASRVRIAPTQASFVAATAARGRAAPPTAVLNRRVIARTAPPVAATPIATRIQAIQRNGAQPLAASRLRQTATAKPGTAAQVRVQVVGNRNAPKPQPLPTRAAAASGANTASERIQPARVVPGGNGRAPANAPAANAAQSNPNVRGQPNAAERGTLPSARFAPHQSNPAATAAQPRGNATTIRGNAATPTVRTQAAPRTDVQNARGSTPIRSQPVERSAPSRIDNAAPSNTPRAVAPRQAVPQPQMRQAPPRAERDMPQQRNVPQPQERAAPQREIRQAPQVRAMPQPQQRSAPPVQRAQPAPRAQPQQRAQPQERGKKDDDDKDRR
jgi:hypothetical protein